MPDKFRVQSFSVQYGPAINFNVGAAMYIVMEVFYYQYVTSYGVKRWRFGREVCFCQRPCGNDIYRCILYSCIFRCIYTSV